MHALEQKLVTHVPVIRVQSVFHPWLNCIVPAEATRAGGLQPPLNAKKDGGERAVQPPHGGYKPPARTYRVAGFSFGRQKARPKNSAPQPLTPIV